MGSRDEVGDRLVRLARNPILWKLAEAYRRLEAWWCRNLFHCSA